MPSLPQDDKACKAPTPIRVGAGLGGTVLTSRLRTAEFEMIEDVMSGYRFKVGQTVSYIPHFGAGAAKSTYKIIQLLPPEGGDFQYRIKSADCA